MIHFRKNQAALKLMHIMLISLEEAVAGSLPNFPSNINWT